MAVADMTRTQICENLADLAAGVGASKEAVLGLLALAKADNTNPASNIVTVRSSHAHSVQAPLSQGGSSHDGKSIEFLPYTLYPVHGPCRRCLNCPSQ